MRVFKTVLLVAFFGASVRCLPIADSPTEFEIKPEFAEITSTISQETAIITTAAPTSTYSDATDYYDQRQNGTENYRIHVDGLVFVFAPVEALLLAGAGAGPSEPNASSSNQGTSSPPTQSVAGELNKPFVDSIHNKTDLPISKTIHKQPAVRLANFLAPLIHSIRHVRGTSVH
ncbi:hypothetical protein PUN28_003803 [Cardiocondyla obscurior]